MSVIGAKKHHIHDRPFRVAVIGGGPGGIFSAWHLAAKAGIACEITIFEASERLGGKIHTREFPGVGIYEAGVAEIYDYSRLGPDPLLNLIKDELGLKVKPISGGACTLGDMLIQDCQELRHHCGSATSTAVAEFKNQCASLLSHSAFYKSERNADNTHPWAELAADEVLKAEVPDAMARQYLRVMSHSDVAAPPHQTNGLTFLKNALMDVDGYLDVVSVVGGNNLIVEKLARELTAKVRLNAQVRALEPLPDQTYRLSVGVPGFGDEMIADYVIFALPLTALAIFDWRSHELRRAMQSHIAHFDHPGHYLRATLLFERPFWREHIAGDWWMTDAFDGACIYDESARHDMGSHGALGFLITGNAALGMVNLSDERIVEMCLESLPATFQSQTRLFLEARVHRWMASVNAWPGGSPVRPRQINHQPLAQTLPGVLIAGDYLFDSTVNGVLDSADTATDLIIADMLLRREAQTASGPANLQVFGPFFDPKFMSVALQAAYQLQAPCKVLLVGDHASKYLKIYRDASFDAWCVYANADLAATIPASLKKYASQVSGVDLGFPDHEFDVVIETTLCLSKPSQISAALDEFKRVARKGIVLASINSELTIDVIERYNLLEHVQTLYSRWQWAEYFLGNGLSHALIDPLVLAKLWDFAKATGAGVGQWYENDEALLYTFYACPDHNKRMSPRMSQPRSTKPRLKSKQLETSK